MNRMLQWFKFEHLPAHLQEPSKACAELATKIDETLPEGPEKTTGLRKLLEAKDCFVRALLEKAIVLLFLFAFAGFVRGPLEGVQHQHHASYAEARGK